MKKKTFEISQISSIDKVNELSIALNKKEQVSHIKINKNTITFNCVDIDILKNIIHTIDEQALVREFVNGRRRKYDFTKVKVEERCFMFTDISFQHDVNQFLNVIREDPDYLDITYDQQNQLFTLKTSKRDALKALRKELAVFSDVMNIEEYKKPIRSEEIFEKKISKLYIKVAVFSIALALALVTARDHTWITNACWLLTMGIVCENVVYNAFKQIKLKNYFHGDVLFVAGIILSVFAKNYLGAYIAIALYRLSKYFLPRVTEDAMLKIDEAVKMPEIGIRLKDDQEEFISLYEFRKGDVLVVHPQDTIHIPGTIVKGQTQLDTYSVTSSYTYSDVNVGTYVNSGSINVGNETIYIQVSKPYESSRYVELMNLASLAPLYESFVEKAIKQLKKYYTPFMTLLALFVGVVLPIYDFRDYGSLIHIGAVFMFLAVSLTSEEATSLGVLAGFAAAFKKGIIVESAKGLDSINITEVIVYDRFDGTEITEEELDLFKKLAHIGRRLIIFNDGPFALESDQYTIYNDLSVEEKIEIMDKQIGEVVYIGDTNKDIALLQKSFVGVSRGGLHNSHVVENSDIVLIDSQMDKVMDIFKIASQMRFNIILNTLFNILYKVIMIVAVVATSYLPVWLVVLLDVIVSALIIKNSTRVIG